MLSEKIESVRLALAELAGRVEPDIWALVSSCRRELDDARDTASIMESGLPLREAAPEGEVVQ